MQHGVPDSGVAWSSLQLVLALSLCHKDVCLEVLLTVAELV